MNRKSSRQDWNGQRVRVHVVEGKAHSPDEGGGVGPGERVADEASDALDELVVRVHVDALQCAPRIEPASHQVKVHPVFLGQLLFRNQDKIQFENITFTSDTSD